jgi:hypothetical protein
MEERVRIPREFRVFKKIWVYLIGTLISVTLILLFFRLNPATENPPFP